MAFRAQVVGMLRQIFVMSPIALQSKCKRVPNEPIPMYGHSWPQLQSGCLKLETDRAKTQGEIAIGGRYGTGRVVFWPGTEYSATRVSLIALKESIHFDGAIPPGWKYFLMMYGPGTFTVQGIPTNRPNMMWCSAHYIHSVVVSGCVQYTLNIFESCQRFCFTICQSAGSIGSRGKSRYVWAYVGLRERVQVCAGICEI
jgi:hypothetical protein